MTNLVATHTRPWGRKASMFIAGMTAVAALVIGCQTGSPRGDLAANQRILATCDPAAPPASFVQIDGTGSSHSEAIATERMTAIESIVRRTAICSGHLRVIVFSASSAATAVLFDGSLQMHGATENARLKRVPDAVTEVMEQVRAGYEPAVKGLHQGGSDITSQYRLASEWIGQLGEPYRLHVTILTDGCQNIGVDLCSQPLSKQEATALGDQVAVPQLSGASVTVAGLGRVAGSPSSSEVVEGLVAYYDALCQRTTAARCVSVTDYASEGR